MKQTTKDITFDVFPIAIECYIGGTLEEAIDKFCKGAKAVKKEDFDYSKPEPSGRCFMHFDTQWIFMWFKKKDPAIIAHEATHAAFFMNHKLGGIFTGDAHETCCYIVEHIVREVMK